jgi:hypothetical protein
MCSRSARRGVVGLGSLKIEIWQRLAQSSSRIGGVGSGLGCVGALMLPNAQKSVANTPQATAVLNAKV